MFPDSMQSAIVPEMKRGSANPIVSGFSFGLILQAAVGPISLFIFSTAAANGFPSAFAAVIGVTAADALFIFLAVTGVTSFIHSERLAVQFRRIGAVVIALFGILIMLESQGKSILPTLSLTSAATESGYFMKGLLLTAGNPLTILFWGGICSVRMGNTGLSGREMYLFGSGAALSTLLCQTALAAFGSGVRAAATPEFTAWMNFAAGLVIILMALWSLVRPAPVPTRQ